MKEILIFRHAKTEKREGDMKDFERKLTDRGRKDVKKIGKDLAKRRALPDLLLSSRAVRAQETADIFAESSGFNGEMQYLDELYQAYPGDYLRLCAEYGRDYKRIMIVGHNPEIEDFLESLTGHTDKVKTCEINRLSIDIETWSEAATASNTELTERLRP